MDSYGVRFWDIRKLGNGSTAWYRVRWAVDGREHCKSFRARPLADGFLADLKDAVRERRPFSPRTGLPDAENTEEEMVTWYEHARADAVAWDWVVRLWGSWTSWMYANDANLLSEGMVPIQATIIPVFLLIKNLGLVNTRTGLILPVIGTAFGTFLMRQYFLQMPKELGEAATVDGASQWQVFYKVYARLAGPLLATLAVLAFAAYWNEFFRPLIFLSTPSKFTLPLGLVTLQGYLGTGSVSVVLAGVILSLIPTLIVFLVAQRRLVEGLTFGSVKG